MKIISKNQLILIGNQLLVAESGRKQFPIANFEKLLECLRWDPRICELAVTFFSRNWRKINPYDLYKLNQRQESPAALAITLEHVLKFKIRSEKKLFKAWMNLILHQCPKANNEQFFIGVYPFASLLMRENSERPLKLFSKWGFFERNLFLNKAVNFSNKFTETTKEIRQNVMTQLHKDGEAFTIREYKERVSAPLSQRQAERDLQDNPLFRKVGYTRNRRYVPRRPK